MAKKPKETAEFYVMRVGDRLIGEMQYDRERIAEFPQGERIKVELSTGRVPSRLRFYRAFLREVVKATGCAPTENALHQTVKLETGFTDEVRFHGYTVKVPASVAFNAMDEQTFGAFLNEALAFIAKEFGITPEQVFGTDSRSAA